MRRESTSERYLRQATSGLWGRKRREVREELAGHLEERITAYRIGGLSDREATERALAELGAPQHVSRGMVRIHTMPTVMGSSLILMALCLAVVALWPKGAAQTLEGTTFWPSPECIRARAEQSPETGLPACFSTSDVWIAEKALRAALEPQDVKFSAQPSAVAELLRIDIPGTTPVFIPVDKEGETVSIDGRSYERAPDYLSFWNLISRLALNSTLHMKIGGWDNPKFHLNDVSLQLRDDRGLIGGTEFYESYLGGVFFESSAPSLWGNFRSLINVYPQDYGTQRFVSERKSEPLPLWIRAGGDTDEVYGVITFLSRSASFGEEFPKNERDNRQDGSFWLQVVRITDNGTLNTTFPEDMHSEISFMTSFGDGGTLKRGDSIVVRLAGGKSTGGGWYEVVSPESVGLTANSVVQAETAQ